MNKPETLIEFVEDRPGHDLRYSLNSTKISDQLGWKVKLSFEEGLEKTVQWYLDNPEVLNNVSSGLDPRNQHWLGQTRIVPSLTVYLYGISLSLCLHPLSLCSWILVYSVSGVGAS